MANVSPRTNSPHYKTKVKAGKSREGYSDYIKKTKTTMSSADRVKGPSIGGAGSVFGRLAEKYASSAAQPAVNKMPQLMAPPPGQRHLLFNGRAQNQNTLAQNYYNTAFGGNNQPQATMPERIIGRPAQFAPPPVQQPGLAMPSNLQTYFDIQNGAQRSPYSHLVDQHAEKLGRPVQSNIPFRTPLDQTIVNAGGLSMPSNMQSFAAINNGAQRSPYTHLIDEHGEKLKKPQTKRTANKSRPASVGGTAYMDGGGYQVSPFPSGVNYSASGFGLGNDHLYFK